MATDTQVTVSPVVRGLVLFPVAAISAGVFLLLTVFPGSTSTLFAWPMRSPVTAATLGACFGAAAVLLGLALRERYWANARIAVLPALLLLGLTLVASLIDRGAFALAPVTGGSVFALAAAWLWFAAHVGLPLLGLLALGVQAARRGASPDKDVPLPRWARTLVELLAVAMVVAGVLFFVAPGSFAGWWPWPVSELDLRALCAWAITFGAAIVFAVWEDDLRRVRVGLAAFLAFGVLAGLTLLRYTDEIRWAHPSAWLYAAAVLGLLSAGLVGLALCGRPYLRFGDRPVLELD